MERHTEASKTEDVCSVIASAEPASGELVDSQEEEVNFPSCLQREN